MKISINKDDLIIFLTGAGISAESGLSTFRDNNGLWEKYNVYEVATPEGFEKNPKLVWEFYNKRRQQLKTVKPNKAHYAITTFQEIFKNSYIITQNVDNLHERANNKNIIHMHGSLNRIKCTKCEYKIEHLNKIDSIPHCPVCNSMLRPDVVWFGEMPYFMEKILKLLTQCKLFIAIGTSGTVYPAAQFIDIAKTHNAITIYINKEHIHNNSIDYFFLGKASKKVNEVLNEIKKDIN